MGKPVERPKIWQTSPGLLRRVGKLERAVWRISRKLSKSDIVDAMAKQARHRAKRKERREAFRDEVRKALDELYVLVNQCRNMDEILIGNMQSLQRQKRVYENEQSKRG